MTDLVLVTIPFSHYCEKARWALDRAGVAYEERAHLPIAHGLPARLAGGAKTVPILKTPDRSLSRLRSNPAGACALRLCSHHR